MEVPSFFKDFLEGIRLTSSQTEDLMTGHQTLRERLESYEGLSDIIVATFLQGSYKRGTATRPKDNSRSDVDIIVVTNLDYNKNLPEAVFKKFIPFLETYYKNKYRLQGRSIGIELSYVDLDIVPTSAPSESQIQMLKNSTISSKFSIEDNSDTSTFFSRIASSNTQWERDPLLIPDRDAQRWSRTHPLMQIKWTQEKNNRCNQHYINVIKALKWWKKEKYPETKQPKSYPLEHFIGQCCPDGIKSVAEGVTKSLQTIVNIYRTKPYLKDHGVPEHNVFAKLTDEEYNIFYEQVKGASTMAKEAYESQDINYSVQKWRELFGNKFPEPPKKNSSETDGFSKRESNSEDIPEGRFA